MKKLLILYFLITVTIMFSGCTSTNSDVKQQFIDQATYFIINDGQMLVRYLENDCNKKHRQKEPVRSRLNSLFLLINKIKQK